MKEAVGHVEMVLSGMPFFVGYARVVAYHFARDGYAAVVISGVGDHKRTEAGAAVGPVFGLGQVERVFGFDAVVGVIIAAGVAQSLNLTCGIEAVNGYEFCFGYEALGVVGVRYASAVSDEGGGVVFGKEFGRAALRTFPIFLIIDVDGVTGGLFGFYFAQFRAVFMGDASQPDPQFVWCVCRCGYRADEVWLIGVARRCSRGR